MAKSFTTALGSAKKNNIEYAKLEMGDKEFRLVGDLLPRYAYWKELNSGGNSFSIPVECLSFDREKEEFTNLEHDYFKDAFPTSLGSVDFNIQAEGEPVYAVFQVSFRYDTFEFRK